MHHDENTLIFQWPNFIEFISSSFIVPSSIQVILLKTCSIYWNMSLKEHNKKSIAKPITRYLSFSFSINLDNIMQRMLI